MDAGGPMGRACEAANVVAAAVGRGAALGDVRVAAVAVTPDRGGSAVDRMELLSRWVRVADAKAFSKRSRFRELVVAAAFSSLKPG
jgi:ribonuclease HII